MPNQQQVQRQMKFDMATKSALRERGDDESKSHLIEHHFVGGNKAALDELAKIGRMLGFQTSEIQQSQDQKDASHWYFDLLSESPTYLNNLARESLLMLGLGEAYSAHYDGWGTLIVK